MTVTVRVTEEDASSAAATGVAPAAATTPSMAILRRRLLMSPNECMAHARWHASTQRARNSIDHGASRSPKASDEGDARPRCRASPTVPPLGCADPRCHGRRDGDEPGGPLAAQDRTRQRDRKPTATRMAGQCGYFVAGQRWPPD